jgi:hypothetical protein
MQPLDRALSPLRAAWKVITLPQRVAAEWFRLGVEVVGGVPAAFLPFLQPILMTKPDVATKQPFLSDDWIEAARAIRDEYRGRTSAPPVVRINLVTTAVPFRDHRDLNAHVDTSKGEVDIELEHIDNPDLTVTIGYDIAKALLVTMDVNAAMGAFMRGEIKVEGDIAKLMSLQAAQIEPLALEAAGRIQAITE